jgi:hypothetical protein
LLALAFHRYSIRYRDAIIHFDGDQTGISALEQ